MKRPLPTALCALVALLLSVVSVPRSEAQVLPSLDANMGVEFDGKALSPVGTSKDRDLFIGLTECEDTKEFEFSYQWNVLVQVVELWVSKGTSTDCSTQANRMIQQGQRDPQCWRANLKESVTTAGSRATVSAKASTLFSSTQSGECDSVQAGQFTVQLVPVSASTVIGSSAQAPVAGTMSPKAVFVLYTEPPNAPTKLEPSTGDRSLSLSWTGSGEQNTSYRAYFDKSGDGGDAGAECGSGLLVAGKEPPESDAILVENASGEKASLTSLSGVDYGDKVAAAVTTVDIAGNESVLSEVVCLERVDVDTFLDTVDDGSLETCALRPGRARSGVVWSLGLLGLALMLRRRRSL
jgi:hypothetical protein